MIRAALIVLVLPAVLRAQTPEVRITIESLKEVVDSLRVKHRVPAMGAAVLTSKGLRVGAVSGVRKAGTKIAVTEDDLWHLGSDTKAFTAMLLAVLAEKKLIDLETPLEKAFPTLAKKMQAGYRKVTLDNLLRHKGGLPSNLTAGKGWWVVPTTLPLKAQRLDAVGRGLALKPVKTPGEEYSYSNLGFVVAAAAAEQMTKDTYEALLKRHVLEPLGIKDAGYGPMGSPGKIDQPLQHDGKGRPREPLTVNDNPPVMSPSARLHMSLRSWALFCQDHILGSQGKGKLLSAEGYKRLHEAAKGENYSPGAWIIEALDKYPVLTHDGSNSGNYCRAVIVPKLDVAFLIVTNMGPKAGELACKEAMGLIIPRLFAAPK